MAFVDDLESVRARTLRLVGHLDDAALEHQVTPILSPLVWDLAHIAAYEDLWINHRFGGRDLVRGDLAEMYDAFETPRAERGDLPLLTAPEAREYLDAVRAVTIEVTAQKGVDPVVHERVLQHELQHTETMIQAMLLAGNPPAEPRLEPLGTLDEDWALVPAGRFRMGASDDRFAYDNERPRHAVDVKPVEIARHPVTNASWMTFAEGGGYVRREWWSDEGWAWKEEYDITHHDGAAAGASDEPVCCVSWFEAEAYARSRDARLPTEAEWEKASTSDQLSGTGRVWEWTATTFAGYPGFVAHPYREYSEVFFGDTYRVLRGGSWATHPRVATDTFRNWDLPERRQLFAGVRLARDLEV